MERAKRLIVTGVACPPEPWQELLDDGSEQSVICLWDTLSHTSSSDPREISHYITREIERLRPTSIVGHDIGVPLVLMSLIRLNRRGVALDTKVTLLNGAFRRFNAVRLTSTWKSQFLTTKAAVKEIRARGGEVDVRLKDYLARIRAVYRRILLYSFRERLGTRFGLEDVVGLKGKFSIKSPIQIIASYNDPYIPLEVAEQLRRDFGARRFHGLNYGHFPYSDTAAKREVRKLVFDFESSDLAEENPAPRPRPRRRSVEHSREATV